MKNTFLKTAALVGVLLTIAACKQTPSDTGDSMQDAKVDSSKGTLAQIYDARVTGESLSFLTKSNGCTSAQNFVFDITKEASSGASLVAVYLSKPDYCKARTRLVRIDMNLGFQSMGQDIPNKIVVTNPVLPAPDMKK